ncbi:PQQ-binding-like beta-propeller repeat protein [Micromonospora sp. NPDC050417]|uniref:outer membrane protein assembly factor BamB family protein n=1 Tax=Micromonospora sp. NPDC050417 TaxID=3364280 RepID=UPI003790CDD6
MGQIELGDRWTEPTVEDRPLARSWLAARSVRLGVLLALLLATMGAAGTGPARISEVTIPARLGTSVVTGVDRLFLIDPVDPAAESRQQVSAYRLPGGEPLWRVRMPVPGPLGGYTLIGDTLVLTSDWGSVAPRRTVGVDTATGAISWLRTASFDAVSAHGDVLLWTPDADTTGAGVPDGEEIPDGFGMWTPGTLEAIAPDSGAVRWSVELPAGAVHDYTATTDEAAGWFDGPLPDRAMIGLPGGRIEVRDLDSGQVVRSAELPAPGAGGVGSWPPGAVGDLLLRPEGARSLTAYGLERFERRWTIDWDTDRDPWPQPCGAVLCAFRPNGGVRVLDPDTGAVRWSDDRWSVLHSVGPYLIGSDEARQQPAPGLSVLDPGTGRVLGDLGAWQVLGSLTDGAAPADGWTGGPRLIGFRTGQDGRALVAAVDLATVSTRPLAVLSGISGDCRYAHAVLICRRLDATIGVWRLPV